jgi:hypothetical protein
MIGALHAITANTAISQRTTAVTASVTYALHLAIGITPQGKVMPEHHNFYWFLRTEGKFGTLTCDIPEIDIHG